MFPVKKVRPSKHVDNLFIGASTEKQRRADSVRLLQHRAKEDQKDSLQKIQYCQTTVTFLEHVISSQDRILFQKRISVITAYPKPHTKKQLMSFLSLCGYFRSFVPKSLRIEKPMRDITHPRGLSTSSTVLWTEDAMLAFEEVKRALQTPPKLGILYPTKGCPSC